MPEPVPRPRGVILASAATSLLVLAMLLANVPGAPIVGPTIVDTGKYGPHFECGTGPMVHGWPFVFLSHDGQRDPVTWELSAWQIGDNAQWEPALGVINLALLAAGAVATFRFVRRRISRHGYQFGLGHLLVGMLAVALIVGWAKHRYGMHQAQVAHLKRHGHTMEFAEWHRFGPHWLRRVTGPGCWRWGDRLAAVYLEHNELASFPGKDAIVVLRLESASCQNMTSLAGCDKLIAIDMFILNYDGDSYDENGQPRDLWPCLRVIAERRSLQGLNLYEAGVSDRALQELVPLQNLANLELACNPKVTDRGLVHLRSLKSLRRLSLGATSVTKQGVEELQRALPECEIEWSE